MRSSTSSSEPAQRSIPGGRWALTWLCAIAVAVAGVVWLETFARDQGYVPSVKDDTLLWTLERARVSNGSRHTIALLGNSRAQLAFAMEVFHKRRPRWQVAHLAVSGSGPIATLRDLAADPEFRGVAIVDVEENTLQPKSWDSQQGYVDTYHQRWRMPGAMAERWLVTRVQSRLAVNTAAGRRALEQYYESRTWPKAPYLTTHADRSRAADYQKASARRQRDRRVAKILASERSHDPDEWLSKVVGVEEFVRPIQERGGDVVFLRLPHGGEAWASYQRSFPKERFWDRFAAATSATAIHFQDHPKLAALDCPDAVHLSSSHAPRFTGELLTILKQRGVIPRPPRNATGAAENMKVR